MKPVVFSGILASIVVIPVAGYIGYHGVHLPAQRELARLEQRLTEERQTQAIRSKLAKTLEELQDFRKRCASDNRVDGLVNQVTRVAGEQEIELVSIAPLPPQSLPEATQLAVRVEFTSPSYHHVGRFVSALERSPAFVHLDNLSMARTSDRDAVRVALTASTLFVPEITAVNASDGSAGTESSGKGGF